MLKSSTYIPFELSQKQLHQLMNYIKPDASMEHIVEN
jgi:hypothetical protein